MIEVEVENRHPASMPAGLSDGVDHAIAKKQSIRKARERVVVSLIFELFLRGFSLRDVTIVDDDRAH